MLERSHGLTDAALEAIEDLERRVLMADGGRLKLEWGTLRNRRTEEVRDLLWWEDDRLLGFAGVYGFGWPTLELAGMVDPRGRRRGIGRELFDATLPICRQQRAERVLMVVPRPSVGGRALALSLAMPLDHSEHALRLVSPPEDPVMDHPVALREATAGDIQALSQLYLDGFGDGRMDADRPLSDDRARTLMILHAEEVVGTVRTTLDGDRAAIYGFVVAAQWRGRGIGRAALDHVCRGLFDRGAEEVDLEVEVANDRALGLYESLGFRRVVTDDYYELRLT
jgi:ribosomal protein S18 acetylase RimI-like enzyme